MEAKKMLEFLQKGGNPVYDESLSPFRVFFTRGNSIIYFYKITAEGANGHFDSYQIYDETGKIVQAVLDRLASLVRIEKEMDSEYYPIWTKEDGEITQTENFVKLNGKYYTIKFLEQLLNNINEFKRINII